MFKRYVSKPALLLTCFALALSQVPRTHASEAFAPFEVFRNFMMKNANIDYSPNATVRNLKGEIISQTQENLPSSGPFILWPLLDSEADSYEGTSTQLAYRDLIQNRALKDVTVAVIDGGVDIHHKDFQGKIWVNPHEVAGNHADNDQDGYENDVNGWNFIGALDGSSLESVREFARMATLLQSGKTLTPEENKYLEKLKKDIFIHQDNCETTIRNYTKYLEAFLVLEKFGYSFGTAEEIAQIPEDSLEVQNAKTLVAQLFKQDIKLAFVKEVLAKKKKELNFAYNPNFDAVSIIHDHPEVLNEKGYGSSDVIGPNPLHGTHVAGIILSQAKNAKIMALRVIPDGDERDKDVANAIRFAVDHGARVINLSFGKAFSPQKAYVDVAVRYAEKHNVLIVHAAGNDGKDNDGLDSTFPNAKYLDGSGYASNWIEVGASSESTLIRTPQASSLAASFSNYGKHSVDLFAPGTHIISTSPGNHYADLQGTSMAAPEVAGVAALLLGLKPELSAQELKSLLTESATRYASTEAIRPGSWINIAPKNEPVQMQGKVVPFSELSITGGIVNVYRAIQLLNTSDTINSRRAK